MALRVLGSSIVRSELAIPLFTECVAAGFPSPAQDYVEGSLDLNELCIQHPAATFFVRVEGESMTEAGIHPNDVLVVDRSVTPKDGDIVIASVDGEFTVKELRSKPTPRLVPRNPAFSPIEIPEDGELEVFGVVTSVVRQLARAR